MTDESSLLLKENKLSVFDRLSIKNYNNIMKEKKVEQTYQIVNFFDEQHKNAISSIFLYQQSLKILDLLEIVFDKGRGIAELLVEKNLSRENAIQSLLNNSHFMICTLSLEIRTLQIRL